jgi:hypothetical protein
MNTQTVSSTKRIIKPSQYQQIWLSYLYAQWEKQTAPISMTAKAAILEANGYSYCYDLGADVHVWALNGKRISIHYNRAKATHDAYAYFAKAGS